MITRWFRSSVRPARRFLHAAMFGFGLTPTAAVVAADSGFAACIADLQATARAEGLSDAVVDDVLGSARQLESVIELDRKQPEFIQTFGDYYNRRVTQDRVAKGRTLLREHRPLLERVQRDTGVPPHYLVAFWGLETNFGGYFGNTRVTDSLATLACDPRRGSYFARELLAALRIVDAGDIRADRMVGSWAGAMGHVQFMPSTFLRFAVDGDGDGRRDLWASVPDAMASAGNFLEHLGWNAGGRWGREVLLPDGFDYTLAGRHQARSLREWSAAGVTDAFGTALPSLDMRASLLVPAGHTGPAFLVYDNFHVIMGWNRSEYYALAVGRLADELAGAGPLQRPPPTDALRLTRDEVRQLQADLNRLGFDAGEADGVFGPASRTALAGFQRELGLVADGHISEQALDAVRQAAAQEHSG